MIRLVTPDDAGVLAALLTANRAYLAPWDPIREDSFYTEAGQREKIVDLLGAGTAFPYVIIEDGEIVGRVNLNNVVLGTFLSASLGYWVAESAAGRGVATRAVADVVDRAFTEHGLHRVEAGTLTHNVRSQRVLERNGFTRFGLAPRYLKIAGEWQDHILFQKLNEPDRR
ncbi:putative GCN5-related N-acetyltransferase [Actinoplanes missouriensis 431]|uniref:Putative GCN5-related N-acetyltransferase n=1 Tax=Actinoplanes missouriensis (strain ATCC 14538 / DSM 43046 / CBS 188.64 / JCM 3121 / NBRC 102363 / NCIMB 12654 / NRRL B-3342 / UNCC 431) TaxID=512565 RepID=I0HH45_ACTM4|nr:GNAT family N-acetyltransferase [Actinoplanes missouriensis]BAL92332.1 putative GCN5-related N-acetyltransferase [Actinoplanes missouriensis 431]